MLPLRTDPHAKQILVADDDLGFLLWFGLALAAAGYAAFPVHCGKEALHVARHLGHPLDLLAINPDLPGACSLVNSLREAQPGLAVLALLGDSPQSVRVLPGSAGSVHKPPSIDRHARARMVRLVDRILIRHRAA